MKAIKRKALSIVTVMTMLSFSLVVFIPGAVAAPQTFVVNSTADLSDANPGDGVCETSNEGECTLRAAIEEANANEGADTIHFNISGDPQSVHTIVVDTPLPSITQETHIDGYSQPGASANTAPAPEPLNSEIKIEVQGTNPQFMTAGLTFVPGSAGSSVKGLSIFGHSLAVVNDEQAANIFIADENITVGGNYLGVRADGVTTIQENNDIGISLFSHGVGARIGSTDPIDRNIIYSFSESNQSAGIFGGALETTIYGNYIGIAKDGETGLTHVVDATGILGPYSAGLNLINGVSSPEEIGNRVGGPGAGMKNVISGGTAGVILSSVGNYVQGNYIGTNYRGEVTDTIFNGLGVTAVAGSYNLIGGTNPGEGNLIAGVNGAGIAIASMLVEDLDMMITPFNNSIIGNSIHEIGIFAYEAFGEMNQGIDLEHWIDSSPSNFVPDVFQFRGPNSVEDGNQVGRANGFINFPVLKTAVQTGNTLDISFDLNSATSSDGSYRVEFFANDNSTIFGYGPGQTYLGHVTTTNGEDLVASLDVSGLDLAYKSLSATATAHDAITPWGFGNTSEFSQNIQIGTGNDFDADGISDAMEDLAPNNGDGNNDGIPDRLQPTVSSYTIGSTPVTFVTQGCSANGSVSSLPADSLSSLDKGYSYPYGLTDFTLNCSRGDTVTVTKYVYDEAKGDLSNYHVRKYIPATDEYIEVEEASVERQEINGSSALVMSYSITDGGKYDDDGEANGVIVDPVGIARVSISSTNTDDPSQGNSASRDIPNDSQVTGALVNTGANEIALQVIFAIVAIAVGVISLALLQLPKRFNAKRK